MFFFFMDIGKRRRQTKDFPGAELILNQIKSKPKKKRVGLSFTGPPGRGLSLHVLCLVIYGFLLFHFILSSELLVLWFLRTEFFIL